MYRRSVFEGVQDTVWVFILRLEVLESPENPFLQRIGNLPKKTDLISQTRHGFEEELLLQVDKLSKTTNVCWDGRLID